MLLSVLLVIATLRGDVPEPDGGEDVDLTQRADWVTVAKLVGVLVFTIATVNWLGWAISGRGPLRRRRLVPGQPDPGP